MSFASDFTSCLSPFPSPTEFLDSAGDLVEFLETLLESAGGDEEATIAGLAAAGAIVGLDEAALAAFAAAGALTVGAYIAACASCLASAIGSAIWDEISQSSTPAIQQALASAAKTAGVEKSASMA